MADYTYAQLEGLWIQAGGSKTLAPVMAAIALAESSGNPGAYNPSGATGLWQILGAVNPADQSDLTNPQVNAKEAVLKYNSQGLGAWVTYTSGAYKQFLRGGVAPATVAGLTSSTSSTSGAPSGWSAVTGFFSDIDKDVGAAWHAVTWLINPANWVRVFVGVGAAFLLAFGLFALAKAVA